MKHLHIVLLILLTCCTGNLRAQPAQLVNAFPALTFSQPVFLTHSGDSTDRIWVVQQDGIIAVFPNDSTAASTSTFLDISEKLSSPAGEEGLLGLAFHPRYAANGYFYVNYTAPNPLRTVIARYSVLPNDPNKADSLSEVVILEIAQPYGNHNGGMIMFGADGCLYIATGDGGSGGDPHDNGQNKAALLGKILRINVDTTTATTLYGIPPDNPFAGNTEGFKEEIWAWGFRNPWRFSEDRITGRIWVGDVGQNAWEEIDLLERGGNYGWRCYEGPAPYDTSGCGPVAGYLFPVKAYPNGGPDCAVTGGYVYRGWRRPDLVGRYIYGDYCSGKIWTFNYTDSLITNDTLLIDTSLLISSFGVDRHGELYVCNHAGTILRFAQSPLRVDEEEKASEGFHLEQNYPNPFNPATHIRFHLPPGTTAQEGIPDLRQVKLTVYNILGQEVATLVNEHLQPGRYQVLFEATGLASGIYFYRLNAGDFTATRKLLIVK